MKISKGFSFLLSFLFCLLFISCRKEKLRCTAHCNTTTFAGNIIDKTTNAPISNQTINVILRNNRSCLLCPKVSVGSAKSDNNGRFSFEASIDSTLFDDQHILVYLQVPKNYISYPEPIGPGILTDALYENIEFYKLDTDSMANMQFSFYPAVVLTINMHRITPVSMDKYAGLEFSFDNKASGWGLQEAPSNTDTSLTIRTSANIFTKIITRKFVSSTSVVSTLDSIKCITNGNNVITVNY